MVTYTALIALAENGYSITDISAANCEYIIDRATDYVNLLADTSIADMTGVAGVKTVTLTDDQNAVVGLLVACMLREMKRTALTSSTSTGTSTSGSLGVGNISMSESSSLSSGISAAAALNGADDFTRSLFMMGIKRLIGSNFRRA